MEAIMNESHIKIIFAKNLCKYVKQSGKTQKELAKIIGVSEPTFSAWCKGTKAPRMDKIEKISACLGISKSDLIEETPLPQLRFLSGLEKKQFTAEEEKEILDYIDYLLSKRKKVRNRISL